MQEDVAACNDVISMWDYVELSEIEKQNSKALTSEQRAFLIRAERAAGIL